MDIVEIRKELHQIPELGGKEFKTKEYIIEKLKDYPCELFHIGKTSIVAYYNFNKKEFVLIWMDYQLKKIMIFLLSQNILEECMLVDMMDIWQY